VRVGTSRDQLILSLKAARTQVLDAISGLSQEQMSLPEIEGWSAKDHLNHLTVWDEFRFYEISRIARGGAPAFPSMNDEDIESLNAITIRLRRGLPLPQVLKDMEFVRSMILQAISGCPEEPLSAGRYSQVGFGGSHDLDHAATLRTWREREGS